MPVFAALDGRVLSVQQGVGGDFNWGPTVSNFDNHIILDHGGEQQSVYGHLAGKSITVKKGQWVAAGTQIGLTASSGNSSWPHLHFTVRQGFAPYEPFAGACGTTAGWVEQPAIPERRVGRRRRAEREGVQRAGATALRRGGPHRHVRPRRADVNVRDRAAQLPPAAPGRLSISDGRTGASRTPVALTAPGSRVRLGEAAAAARIWRRSDAGGCEYELDGRLARRGAVRRRRDADSASSTGRRAPSRRRSSPRRHAPARSSSAGSPRRS